MAASPPNILFIMADDHAAKSISCYGAGINHTPNIDRIANEGMRFNHCYVTNSICTPSRATILTGTHNHVNGVSTLGSKLNNRISNVAKQLRNHGNYSTAMIGKWHLGEGPEHEPTGFDHWTVVPGQGEYWDPAFIEMGKHTRERGYCTDLITDKTIKFLDQRPKDKPFFVMCHHKAPHRKWEYHPRHHHLYRDEIKVPESFGDDYKNRAKAAAAARMRISEDLDYFDLGLVQPEGGEEVGELAPLDGYVGTIRMVPHPEDVSNVRLIDKATGHVFTFKTQEELHNFKYQRYMQRYLRTIQAVDDGVGRLLDYLDQHDLTRNTIVIYTSDQGFFLGEHGWYDKRYMYEESFQMPFLIRYPAEVQAGTVCNDIISNVDFAPTWLDQAGVKIPSYMQGRSFRDLTRGSTPADWRQLAFHRYWMHRDIVHNCYAHYGVRNQGYKLIYWYNEGFGLPGTREGGQDREWEFFDCEQDPLELINCYHDTQYAEVIRSLRKELEDLMAEIGDEPCHERPAIGL